MASLPRMLAAYQPDVQYRIADRADRCFTGKAPTLAAVRRDYGAEAAVKWLEIQIHDLAAYAGVRDKLTDAQSQVAAYTILATYYYLKLSELLLFFLRFKSGRYGRFYGAVDPLVITSGLQTFVRERRDALFRIESERQVEERRKPRTGTVSREQYEELKRRAAAGDREAARRLMPPAAVGK